MPILIRFKRKHYIGVKKIAAFFFGIRFNSQKYVSFGTVLIRHGFWFFMKSELLQKK